MLHIQSLKECTQEVHGRRHLLLQSRHKMPGCNLYIYKSENFDLKLQFHFAFGKLHFSGPIGFRV